MHMTDLCDMLAGTSTGSILSAGLSIPSPTNSSAPRYYATDAQNIYIDNADVIFKRNHFNWFQRFSAFVVFILFFTCVFHIVGYYKYNNPKAHKAHAKMHDFLQERKKVLNKKVKKE